MKIHQSAFIRDLVIDEALTNCNANIILIKAGSSIEITNLENYKIAHLRTYQRLVEKLMYLLCSTKPDIVFVVEQLSK